MPDIHFQQLMCHLHSVSWWPHWSLFCIDLKGENLRNFWREITCNIAKNYKNSLLIFLGKCADRSLISARPLCPFDHASNRSWMISLGNSFSPDSRILLMLEENLGSMSKVLGYPNPLVSSMNWIGDSLSEAFTGRTQVLVLKKKVSLSLSLENDSLWALW